MAGWLIDLRYTVRGLRRAPGLLFVAVLTIALGVGANTAMFSVVNAVLLRPLPYPAGERLVSLWPEKRWSIAMLEDVRERVDAYRATSAHTALALTLYGGREPEPVAAAQVTHEHFRVLGVRPVLGRDFVEGDAAAASGDVVILSHPLWQRVFGGDPGIIGRSIELAGRGATHRTVVGVMPASFTDLHPDARAWVPIITTEGVPGFAGQYGFSVTGRLKDGVPAARASAQLRALVSELTPVHPTQFREIRYSPVDVVPLLDRMVREARPKLVVLLGVVGFVLLIAASNVANLLLARSASRQRNVALQLALGSSRLRVVRQVLLESVLLGLAGGAAGVLVAAASLPLLRRFVEAQLPRSGDIGIDLGVLAFAIAISLGAAVLFGALPALRAIGLAPTGMLRESSRSHSAGRGAGRVNDALVATEVALSLVLLTGAGLMLESLARLSRVDPGFSAESVLTLQVTLPPGSYDTPERREAFAHQALARLGELPGVTHVGSVTILPLSSQGSAIPYQVEGEPVPEGEAYQVVSERGVTAGYFDALRIPLLRGRMIDGTDEDALLVNEAFAQQHWPGQDPLGRRLLGSSGGLLGVVTGVVGDVRQQELSQQPIPELYYHASGNSWYLGNLLVRSSGSAPPPAEQVVAALREIEPALAVRDVRPMTEIVEEALGNTRFFARLFTLFAAIALALGLVGVYGVMSYAMTRRFRELGVRMALGATSVAIVRGAVARALLPIVLGVVVGILGALAGGRLMTSLLYDVRATDPRVLAVVAAVMLSGAALGALVPAVRAVRLDPVSALRVE